MHDTQIKHYRHLNFFEHECFLEVRVPRVKLPDGSVRLLEPPWAGNLSSFTLLFEALVLNLCREMPFAAVARHYYVTLATDAERRVVNFVTETREAQAVERLAADLTAHRGDPGAIKGVSIAMSPAYIKSVEAHLPNVAMTFGRFHMIAHASMPWI